MMFKFTEADLQIQLKRVSYKQPFKIVGYKPSVLGLEEQILKLGVTGLKLIAEVGGKVAEYVKGPHSVGKVLLQGPARIDTAGQLTWYIKSVNGRVVIVVLKHFSIISVKDEVT